MSGRWASRLAARWRADRRGVAAVEFAFTVPVLLVVYLMGFELSEAMATYRKLSDATVELANVTAQYTTMGCTDVTSVMNASSQIMAPYPTQNLTIVVSEITTDNNNIAKVTWSETENCTAGLTPGSVVTLPPGLASQSTSYILVQTTYLYNPIVGGSFIGSIPMTDQIYMLPRASPTIPYTG
jgi:Flp pilus assembly protein TadG